MNMVEKDGKDEGMGGRGFVVLHSGWRFGVR